MLKEPVYYSRSDYISTVSGNRVSRKSVLCGSQNIHIAGRSIIKPGVVLRGDLAMLRIGKFVIIGEDTVIRPPVKKIKDQLGYFSMTVGDYVMIGKNCVISAAQIGSNVSIGDNCIIGKRCVIKDNSTIMPCTVLPPDTTVPPFTVFKGFPGRLAGDLPESAHLTNKEDANIAYRIFTPKSTND